ncbi:hypothetical protein ACWEK5_46385 [Rhodococcus koreensis]
MGDRTDTDLPRGTVSALHRRFSKAGGRKAAVAIAHDPVVVWHIPHDEVDYTDLGADYYTQRDNPEARRRQLLRQLEGPGLASRSVQRPDMARTAGGQTGTSPSHLAYV